MWVGSPTPKKTSCRLSCCLLRNLTCSRVSNIRASTLYRWDGIEIGVVVLWAARDWQDTTGESYSYWVLNELYISQRAWAAEYVCGWVWEKCERSVWKGQRKPSLHCVLRWIGLSGTCERKGGWFKPGHGSYSGLTVDWNWWIRQENWHVCYWRH